MAHQHFSDKSPLAHVIEKQSEGIASAAEIHGTEIPGRLFAGADAARETGVVLLLVWTLLTYLDAPHPAPYLTLFACGWLAWKAGRSAWLGWSRLERLHRILEQEKWEIEHNRPQEKEELKELYAAKGFEGKLLDDVVDVLMADNDRALRVMVQEELGLSLEVHDHPLRQAAGAAIGTLAALLLALAGLFAHPQYGLGAACLFAVGLGAAFSAHYERNRMIPAVVWNVGLAALSFATVFFLTEALLR